MKVSSVAQMRGLDQSAIEQFGIRAEILMENAGAAAYFVLHNQSGIKGNRFRVFSGVGNNGGDGFVVARKIHSNGGDVRVFILGDPNKLKGAAKTNLDIVMGMPIDVRRVESVDAIEADVYHADVLIDAIFGTGLTREVTGLYREMIDLINRSGATVLSLDIPSGVHGDNGQIMGAAVQADYTATFGLPKLGNMLYPGHDRCGKIYVSHISFPPTLYDADTIRTEINHPPCLPPRDKSAHKGQLGDVLFVAGAANYFGAPYFAALSFLKAGGGYSRLAAPRSMTPFIATKGSEIVFVPQKEQKAGAIALENKNGLLELAEKVDMVVLGPGLSLADEAQRLARELAAEMDKPLLIDGDGITALSEDLKIIEGRKAETILTPHLGEMARITGAGVPDIRKNRIELLQDTAEQLGAIIVLKGAHSLIGYPDRRVYINMSGNPGMATAGSGDVLTGTIAAMYGLGLELGEAVRMGVLIHGFSGDLAANDKGEDGITAQDILEYLPLTMKTARHGIPSPFRERYEGVEVI
jgi:NAD(P)H-hydrate epimerase